MSSESRANSRHFKWLMKSCFPDPRHHPHPPPPSSAAGSLLLLGRRQSISSLPDDLLLEILSRVPLSSVSCASLVCRRWSSIIHSLAFLSRRRLLGTLRQALVVVSISSDSGLRAARLVFDRDGSWRSAGSLLPHDVVPCLRSAFSHPRVVSIGPEVYVIGISAMLRQDTWTGKIAAESGPLVPRKKFAAAVVAGKIFVAGGASRTAAVEEYDPAARSWRVVCQAPRMRCGCLGASVGGVFYVIGGFKIGAPEGEASRSNPYASSMDLYDVEGRAWLRTRAVPGGGCVVAACATERHVYVLSSHAVELSFWRFDGFRARSPGASWREWCRLKPPPMPAKHRLDGTARFSCVGAGERVALIQSVSCVDDSLSGRRWREEETATKKGLVLVYDPAAETWSCAPDLPELGRRAACACVEC